MKSGLLRVFLDLVLLHASNRTHKSMSPTWATKEIWKEEIKSQKEMKRVRSRQSTEHTCPHHIHLIFPRNKKNKNLKNEITELHFQDNKVKSPANPFLSEISKAEKVGLKLNIQKTKIMASGPITSWEIDGETVSDIILGGSKITADGDCSHEIKRCLLLGRKVMSNLDSIFKSRDITLPTKVRLVKVMVFPVVMYGCESWTVKKAEC